MPTDRSIPLPTHRDYKNQNQPGGPNSQEYKKNSKLGYSTSVQENVELANKIN